MKVLVINDNGNVEVIETGEQILVDMKTGIAEEYKPAPKEKMGQLIDKLSSLVLELEDQIVGMSEVRVIRELPVEEEKPKHQKTMTVIYDLNNGISATCPVCSKTFKYPASPELTAGLQKQGDKARLHLECGCMDAKVLIKENNE